MKFPKEWQLQDEVLIKRKGASAVFHHSVIGLSKITPDRFTSFVGLKDKEALGGMLYLTNYRLLFRSHFLNRARGTFSIFLPSIRDVRITSFGANRNITVDTDVFHFNYIVWGIPSFVELINETIASSKSIKFDNDLRKALLQERLDISSSEFLLEVNDALTEDIKGKLRFQ